MERVKSIDALRGFDMMLIVGGREAILGLTALFGSSRLDAALLKQFEHPEWHGFAPWDMVFPLFLFLAGASLPFSFAARAAAGASRANLAVHALRRAAILVGLGIIYNGLLGLEFDRLRYASVLGRIGLAWAGAALVMLYVRRVRWQVAVFLFVLGLHACLLLFVPAPGLDEVSLAPGETFTDWIDRHVTPGRLHRTVRDPEAIMGTIPAIGTALLGSFAGRWLQRTDLRPGQQSGGLVLLGVQCLAGAMLLELLGLPINKNLWTASFALWAGGWSVLLLAVFHVLFDRIRLPRAALFFGVIGANSILAYMLGSLVDFRDITEIVFARGLERGKLHAALVPVLAFGIQWMLFFWLYRRRILWTV